MTIEGITEAVESFQSALAAFQTAETEFHEADSELKALPEYKAWDKARDKRHEAQNAVDLARSELANALGDLYLQAD